jgi:hypothetical protein
VRAAAALALAKIGGPEALAAGNGSATPTG